MDQKYQVVVVDDYRISRTFFEMMVQNDVRYALTGSFSNAGDAVAFCLNHPVDLVILDVMMRTGIDGITAARKIKEQKSQIRIILATSTAEAAWEDDAREIGVESFWYKEYSEESLSEVIERTIAGEHVYPHNPVDIKLGNTNRVELSDRHVYSRDPACRRGKRFCKTTDRRLRSRSEHPGDPAVLFDGNVLPESGVVRLSAPVLGAVGTAATAAGQRTQLYDRGGTVRGRHAPFAQHQIPHDRRDGV